MNWKKFFKVVVFSLGGMILGGLLGFFGVGFVLIEFICGNTCDQLMLLIFLTGPLGAVIGLILGLVYSFEISHKLSVVLGALGGVVVGFFTLEFFLDTLVEIGVEGAFEFVAGIWFMILIILGGYLGPIIQRKVFNRKK